MKPITAADPDEVEFVDDDVLREHTKMIMNIIHKEECVKAKVKKAKRKRSQASRKRNR